MLGELWGMGKVSGMWNTHWWKGLGKRSAICKWGQSEVNIFLFKPIKGYLLSSHFSQYAKHTALKNKDEKWVGVQMQFRVEVYEIKDNPCLRKDFNPFL